MQRLVAKPVKPGNLQSNERRRAAADDAAQHRDAPARSVVQGGSTNRSCVAQQGFSLLEVLVAIVILSFGILGLAGLQNAALKNGHSAMLRAQAAQYAYDIVDRMRVNRTAAVAGDYDLTIAADKPTGTSLPDRDRAGWLTQIESLPAGDGSIAVTATGVATVVVQWSEAAIGGGTAEFKLVTEL